MSHSPGTLSDIVRRTQRPLRSEEAQLIRRAQAGDVRARDRVVEGNLRLVLYVARRYQSTALSLEDMLQEGVVGLIDALERFNPDEGNSFSSYAVPWIRLRIGRAVYRMGRVIRMPERSERLLGRWNQLCESWNDEHGQAPTIEEGAAILGVTVEALRSAVEASHPIAPLSSLDADGESHTVEEFVADPTATDPYEAVRDQETWSEIRSGLNQLRPSYRQVIEESFGLDGVEPLTLNDIARRAGVTKQAVSGLRKRALDALRANIEPSLAA